MLDAAQIIVLILALYGLSVLAATAFRTAFPRRRQKGFRPFLSLLVLVKNGEATVEGVVRNLVGLPYVNHWGLANYDVVVVDEHSGDQTSQIIERLGRRYSHIKLVRAPAGASRSAAIEAGLGLCRGNAAIVLDTTGDLDHRELLRTVYYLVGPRQGEVAPRGRQVLGFR
ncbi:MAG: glycosyltransferase family 2 protein [Bacillota bacterium]